MLRVKVGVKVVAQQPRQTKGLGSEYKAMMMMMLGVLMKVVVTFLCLMEVCFNFNLETYQSEIKVLMKVF